jgi:hypothetical protein
MQGHFISGLISDRRLKTDGNQPESPLRGLNMNL